MAKAAGGKTAATSDYLESSSDLYAFELKEIQRRRRRSGRRATKPDCDPQLNVASDLTGLALSGGGVRSAATCLGAIQALQAQGRLTGFDYLSTVSGGGYIGARLSAALAGIGGKDYPFGEGVSDSPVVSHLRDYSNYLMPRSRSLGTNLADGAVIIIRGLIANAICILAFLLPLALLSAWLFSRNPHGGALAFLFDRVHLLGWGPLLLTYLSAVLALLLLFVLLVWAALRAFPRLDEVTGDTASALLRFTRFLVLVIPLILVLELQPLAVDAVDALPGWLAAKLKLLLAVAVPAGGAIATFASTLGNFLKRSEHQAGRTVALRRGLAKLLLYVGAAILPLLLWLSYLVLTDQLMKDQDWWRPVTVAWLATAVLIWFMRPNGYSLHGFYRDRLSKAFLVDVPTTVGKRPGTRKPRLSDLKDSDGPYPLINAALNIQGSQEANQRGRQADFFVFTPDYIGSQLTGYRPTAGAHGYEARDSRIDLASAIAISGAAVSANMGSHTVKALSPTLSLLNVRLGYWIKNPRPLVPSRNPLVQAWRWLDDQAFLLTEMFNRADEFRSHLFVSDGGHIENLGIYQLLQRRCGLILAIDAEADPNWSCSSLLKLERYARIDLGVRIEVPWEQIAARSVASSKEIRGGAIPTCNHGPHCAVGPIYYDDGTLGVLIYVKSSLTGDEKDYIIDYARRFPTFPHETTGDQFFSEEQFEMYRALGFHMVNRFFYGDEVATARELDPKGPDAGALRRLIGCLLPAPAPKASKAQT